MDFGPECLVGDKSYSYKHTRGYLFQRKITAVISLRFDQGQDSRFDRDVYRERNKVERLTGCLEQWRRIATRYEKRATNYLAMLILTSIVLRSQFEDVP